MSNTTAVENVADAFIARIEGKEYGEEDVELDQRMSDSELRFLRKTIREATGRDALIMQTTSNGKWRALLLGITPTI